MKIKECQYISFNFYMCNLCRNNNIKDMLIFGRLRNSVLGRWHWCNRCHQSFKIELNTCTYCHKLKYDIFYSFIDMNICIDCLKYSNDVVLFDEFKTFSETNN